jgi:hypothetical protein
VTRALPVIQRGRSNYKKRQKERQRGKYRREERKEGEHMKKTNQCRGIKDETGLNNGKAIE